MSDRPSAEVLHNVALNLRVHALRMVHRAKASHLGSCLSMADIIACLYWDTLRIDPGHPNDPNRDRFILSKGHAAALLYAALAERGFFPIADLDTFSQSGSSLTGHVNSDVPGVEFSSGSLGHGLPVACGLTLAAKRVQRQYRTFVLVSDGELDEGSNWEAILFSAHHKLDNLVLIVDYNKIQSFGRVSEVLELHPLAEKFQSFRWNVIEIDGHNISQIQSALAIIPAVPGTPTVVLAHTVKGKGVAFMEDQLMWHYKSPSDAQLEMALRELEASR